jgi:signal transduction histidine kinase/DNA-binding response OmpR family regulator
MTRNAWREPSGLASMPDPLAIQSEPDLPRTEHSPPPDQRSSARSKHLRAVIMENDPEAGLCLQNALTTLDYEWVTSATEKETQELLALHPSSLLLVNLDPAPEAALAFCQSLRVETNPGALWIIVSTANPDLAEEALRAGADDVLLRPLNVAAAQVRILLAARGMDQGQQRREQEKAAEFRASTRAQQQVAVAALGEWALVNVDLDVLIGQAVLFAAQTLEADCCGFWELCSGGSELCLRDGTGWGDGNVGMLRIPADTDYAEARAMRQGPVVVEDWAEETRFRMPKLFRKHHLCSSLAVPVSGVNAPGGVLSAHAKKPNRFSEDDLRFLQAVAVVLSLAIERRRSEAAIQRLAAFPRCNPNPALELNTRGELTYANEAAVKAIHSFRCNSVLDLLPENHPQIVRETLASGPGPLQQQVVRAGRTLAWSFFAAPENQAVHAYAEEITKKLELEAQLRKLQKMECVGQLAAGLAHDFNNVMAIIRGHSEALLSDYPRLPKEISSLKRILGAVDRASTLTRQLLTFSRRQVTQTKPLNLNDCLANSIRMLEPVLGENIQLIFKPSPEGPMVLGDSGMLDQAVTNLAVNARDAMPLGGRLTLATLLVELDAARAKRNSEARPGKFVCLRISDTGCGMDTATLARIFEPFFTTKDVGQGAGLGLSAVYGIVKQHQGWIEVSSRVGHGTQFSVFLPQVATKPVENASHKTPDASRGGAETILLVDDEVSLRELARLLLERHGYKVLDAGCGNEALRIWAAEKDRIDLLLTDLVMPEGMTGLELGRRLVSEKPSLKTVYTSGYSHDLIEAEGLQQSICFLQKPYPALKLIETVRELLDTERNIPAEPRTQQA